MAGSSRFPEKYVRGLGVGRNATPSTALFLYPARLILGYGAGLSVELNGGSTVTGGGPRSYYCWM